MPKRALRSTYATADRKLQHTELVARIGVHAEEMRQNKAQQWRTLYYASLVLAALVLAFQQPIDFGPLYIWVKVAALILMPALGVVATIHLVSLKFDIDLNRAAAESMETEIDSITGIAGRLHRLHKPRYRRVVARAKWPFVRLAERLTHRQRQIGLYNAIFTGTFVAVIWLFVISGCLMVFFDS